MKIANDLDEEMSVEPRKAYFWIQKFKKKYFFILSRKIQKDEDFVKL